MILAMIPTAAFADEEVTTAAQEETVKQSIEITGPVVNGNADNSDLFGRTFNVYRIFDANYTGGKFVDYEVAPKFSEFFTTLAGGKENFDAVSYVAGLSKTEDVQAFAAELSHYVRDNKIEVDSTITPNKDDPDSNKATELALGYYFIDEPNAIEGSAAMLGALQAGLNASFTVKSDKPTVEKKIVEDGEEKDITDAKIGDTITFTLTSTIPNNAASFEKDYLFKFHDTLSSGLTFGGVESVSVTIDGRSSKDDEDIVFTASVEDGLGDGDTFVVIIASDTAKKYQGKEVVVTYTAVLNENAVIGSNGNTNEVVVEYSNNPYWEGTPDSSKTEPDTVVVFTLQGNGTKVNAADENVKLGGAEFELYSSKIEDDKEVKGDRIYVNATDEEGIYTTTDANDTAIAANTQIVSVEGTGAFTIQGLKAGTYFLEETKAPDGYNKLKTPIKLVVTPVYGEKDGKTVITSYTVTIEDSAAHTNGEPKPEDGSFDYVVKNTSGPNLPETGGIGTYIFTFGGLILMLAAVALLIYNKKKAAHK